MRSFLRMLLAGFVLAAGTVQAAVEVAGVQFAEQSTLAGQALALNGAGLRTRFMFKVYAMGLYLPAAARTPEAVLAASGPQRIRIVTLRELGADQFVNALIDGLRENHTPEALTPLQPAIAAFRDAMLAVGKAPAGTEVLLDRLPGGGTRLTVSGVIRGEPIADEAFYPALLRVWLGEAPVQADLKRRLLGAAE